MNNDAEKIIGALVLNEADNVAVCLRDIAKNSTVTVKRSDGGTFTIAALNAIDTGHKIALLDLPQGVKVTKYAEIIGTMTRDASRGEHVHIHNLSD